MPCVPTNVSVVMHCANNTALVSWSASRGAVQYSVTARSSHSNTSCQTSDLSCRLKNLTCGSSYTVQVAAMDDNCSSIPSQVVAFNSGETYTTNEQLQFHILVLCKPNVQFGSVHLLIPRPLPTPECECSVQLFLKRHDDFLGCNQRSGPLSGFSSRRRSQ